MNIGIRPSVNFTKQKRDAKPGISVCSRIIRLMNNQSKSQRKATIPPKRRENDDKNTAAIVKVVPQLGCVSQDSDAPSGYNPTHAKKTSQETQKSLQKFLEPTRNPKVIYTDHCLEFGKVLRGIILES